MNYYSLIVLCFIKSKALFPCVSFPGSYSFLFIYFVDLQFCIEVKTLRTCRRQGYTPDTWNSFPEY